MKIRKLYIIVTALLVSSAVYGQGYQVVDSTFTHTKLDQDSLYYDEMAYLDDYHFADNIFLSGQIGISHSMSENTRFGRFFDNEKLSFNIGVGKWVYPAFGVRITAGLHPQVGRAEWEISDAYPEYFGNYTYNMFSGYVDGLVNLTNILLKYKEDRVFNLVGIIGLGYNHTFGFDKGKCAVMRRGINLDGGKPVAGTDEAPGVIRYDVNTNPGNYFAAHVGLQGRWKVSPAWDVVV